MLDVDMLASFLLVQGHNTPKSSHEYFTIFYVRKATGTPAVFTDRIPPVRITQRVGGLPLGEASAIVAEEEGVAETGDVGLARVESLVVRQWGC